MKTRMLISLVATVLWLVACTPGEPVTVTRPVGDATPSPVATSPAIPTRLATPIPSPTAPPAGGMALREQENENAACNGLQVVDEADWDARARYETWLDGLTSLVGPASQRWLHVVRQHQQNQAALAHPDTPMPAAFRSDLWLRLDEAGRIVAQVSLSHALSGELLAQGVHRNGIFYDLRRGEQHPYTPRRPELDGGFFIDVASMNGERRGLARQESEVGERPAYRFSACQSYGDARPRVGELPHPVVGDQRHLWLDAETGQPLRTERTYVDTTGQVQVDWTTVVTVDVVDNLTAPAAALWQRAAQSAPVVRPPTPALPAVSDPSPGISLTLQGASYGAYQTILSLTLQIPVENNSMEYGASLGQVLLFDDAGNQYQPTLGNAQSDITPAGLVAEIRQNFEPGLFPEAQALTLQAGLSLNWPASSPITLDLRGRQPGDRWPVGQTVEFYGLQAPITEAALIADPNAAPDSLTLQLFAPCVSEGGVALSFLSFRVEGGQEMGSGPGHTGCGPEDEQLVSSVTVDALLDGTPPAALETAVLHLEAHLDLSGPWELRWEVER